MQPDKTQSGNAATMPEIAEKNLRQFIIDWWDGVIDRDQVAKEMLEAVDVLVANQRTGRIVHGDADA